MKGTSGGLNACKTFSSWPKRRASDHLIAAEPCRAGQVFEGQRRGWIVVHKRDCPPYICVRHAVIRTAVPDRRREKRAERFGEAEVVALIAGARDPTVELPKPRG